MSILDRVLGRNSSHVSHKLKGAKRLKNESFVKYKARLVKEAKLLKNYLRGDLVWCSVAYKREVIGVDDDKAPIYGMRINKSMSKGTCRGADAWTPSPREAK